MHWRFCGKETEKGASLKNKKRPQKKADFLLFFFFQTKKNTQKNNKGFLKKASKSALKTIE
jgi:hypothetical protein